MHRVARVSFANITPLGCLHSKRYYGYVFSYRADILYQTSIECQVQTRCEYFFAKRSMTFCGLIWLPAGPPEESFVIARS